MDLQKLLATAKPEQYEHRFVWWYCGADNYGLDPAKGILPLEIRSKIKGSIPPPEVMGGVWFPTEESAMSALKAVVDQLQYRRGPHKQLEATRSNLQEELEAAGIEINGLTEELALAYKWLKENGHWEAFDEWISHRRSE